MSETSMLGRNTGADRKPDRRRWNVEGYATVILAMLAWQLASTRFPPFLFPPLQDIASTFVKLLLDGTLLKTSGHTYLRILVALAVAFVVATGAGIAGGLNRGFDRVVMPFVQFKQGVPSVCWIIFSILWFRDIEIRIAFIIVISTFPSFYFLTRDSVRSIPVDLWEMVRAWLPTQSQIVRKLIFPAIVPSMATGLRINIGTAARVAIFAELLGGVSGVGYYLRVAEEQFQMNVVMAWTIVLVVLILVSDKLMALLEARLLRARGRLEHSA